MRQFRISVYAAAEGVGRFGPLQGPIDRQLFALDRACVDPRIGATAQIDREASPAFRYRLEGRGPGKAINLGEGNTGDPRELVDFVRWSRAACPASCEITVLSGHGLGYLTSLAGWAMGTRAILPNTAANGTRDLLTTLELADALGACGRERGRPTELVAFDACLMNTIEVLTEVSPHAEAAVGTPDELSGGGYDLAGAASGMAQAGGGLSPSRIADTFAARYAPQNEADMCTATDLRCFRTVEASLRGVSKMLADLAGRPGGREVTQRLFLQASSAMNRFRANGLADLGALRSFASGVPGPLAGALDAALERIDRGIIRRNAGPAARHMFGISIAAPGSAEQWRRDRMDYLPLRFSRESGWGAMLDRVFVH
jgi:hypothetical protein